MKILELLTPRRLTGNFGERAAARYLSRHGYRILERNYVAPHAEIDLIAKTKDTVVFVEVKTRREGHGHPAEPRPASAVTREKQQRLIQAAKSYIRHTKREGRLRFDIVEVILENTEKPKVKSITHLPSAFTGDTAYRHK